MPSIRPLVIEDGQVKSLPAGLTTASSQGNYYFHQIPTGSAATVGQIAPPAAQTEWPGAFNVSFRQIVNLSFAIQCRLQVMMIATIATGLTIQQQYSTDGGTTWNALTAVLNISGTTGIKISSWQAVPTGLGDVLVRTVTQGGNATNIRISNIILHVE